MKAYLTRKEAVSILPDGDSIHTFYNPGFGLVGADWSREDLLDKLEKSEILELTGPSARSLGHGLCAYTRNMHETLDFLLGQNEKDMDKLKNAVEAQGRTVTTLQTSLVEALQLMSQQYNELNARVTALEQQQA